jgi:hypothetical protein
MASPVRAQQRLGKHCRLRFPSAQNVLGIASEKNLEKNGKIPDKPKGRR